MTKFKLEKLIRHELLIKLLHNEVNCKIKTLSAIDYKNELFSKLTEEVDEIKQTANIKELIEEIADVLEVIDAICIAHDINFKDVKKQKKAKFKDKGTFTINSFVESIEFNHDPKFKPYIEYYQKNSAKYPEIV